MSELTFSDCLAIQAESLWTQVKELKLYMSELQAAAGRDVCTVKDAKDLRREFEDFCTKVLSLSTGQEVFMADVRDLELATFDLVEEAQDIKDGCPVDA
jgi:hypothetical protein